VTKVPVVTPQKPTTYRRSNMSSIGAASAMDIDMSLGPSDPSLTNTDVRNFCFPLGFVLTLEATRCTQLQLGVQNLASSGAGMVASRKWPDSSCHSLVGSFKIEFYFFWTLTCIFILASFLLQTSELDRRGLYEHLLDESFHLVPTAS
jgi:hypothetical protein